MAKRRREPETKEVDWGFEVEPFNEHELVLKEARGFRSSIVVIGWALVAAIVSFLAWNPIEGSEFAWEIALLVGLGVGALLKWVLPLAKIPIAEFKRKDWFGTGMTFFFSWLAFLLLFTNPPIHDGSEPAFAVAVTPRVQEVGGEVFVYVVVGDNAGIDWDTLDLTVTGPGGPFPEFEETGRRGHYVWSATLAREGEYEVHGAVSDRNGNRAALDRHFQVVGKDEAVTVRLPEGGVFDDNLDKLFVALGPCEGDRCLDVWRVAAVFPDGANVTLKYDRDDKVYASSPRVEGNASWGGAGNASFRVMVWEHAAHQRDLPLDEAAVVKGPYNVTIAEGFPVEDGKEPRARQRPLRSQAPALDVALIGLGIVVALALAARKRKA